MTTGSEYQPPAPIRALHELHYGGNKKNMDHDAHTVGLLAYHWPKMSKIARRRVRESRHYKAVMERVNR